MSRWGEEEKKSRGIIGCLVAVGVLIAFVYGFLQVYPVLEGRKDLETRIESIARSAHTIPEEQIRAKIIAAMRDLNIPADPDDLYVAKERKPWGSNDSLTVVVTVRLNYEVKADFVITSYTIPVIINEEVPLIEF